MSEINKLGILDAKPISRSEVIRKNLGGDFGKLLSQQLGKDSKLQFSKHAQERVAQRGIEITPKLLDDLDSAVTKARLKGARDIVIFDNARAFIVNVPNNIVVTTMSGEEMKENVFTNIDSAVII